MISIKDILKESKKEIWLPGNLSCPGCAASLGLRYLARALNGKGEFYVVIPAGCSSVIQGIWPYSSAKFSIINCAFASSAAVATGLSRAFKFRKKKANVVVWAGDGGSADIGLATLSGAAERNEDILYIMYDNEAYMNTGIQRSSQTPFKASTTTTPFGKEEEKKDIDLIMMAHGVYTATASPAFPLDFFEKIRKALSIKGFKFIHYFSPCPPGWRYPSEKTIEVARLAVQSSVFILFEFYNGKVSISQPSIPYRDEKNRKPIEEYLKIQGRFKDIKKEDIEIMKQRINEKWKILEKFE
ncbi:MAG: 3-methyl-2-oxobutanoate dehydrogenase subunit beta [Candidatus Micrarchaeia archaeon]